MRQISAETNARISVMDGMPGSDERVAIITSREDPTQELSGAQVIVQSFRAVHTVCMHFTWKSATSHMQVLYDMLFRAFSISVCFAECLAAGANEELGRR